MTFKDDLEKESESSKIDTLRLRRERDAALNEAARLASEIDTLRRSLEVVENVERLELAPPKWTAPEKPKKSAATLVLMLSDLHFDEVVNPDEVDGLNAYSRTIAELRLKKWGENVVKLARHYLSGVTYDGVVVLLGGDMFSGDIHEELSETNEEPIMASLLFWSERLAAALDLLATEFKKVHVVSVVGNHGRTSRKPRAKLRVRTNYDWLLSQLLLRHFHKDKRMTFQIPESADALINIYGQGHLLTHGDQASGGGGIGGIYPPIMRLRARKAQRYLATYGSFQTLWLGHWHQYISTPSLIINGSLKGYDEYAYLNSFAFEVPQQALALVAPDKGITFQAPVFVQDRKKEGW